MQHLLLLLLRSSPSLCQSMIIYYSAIHANKKTTRCRVDHIGRIYFGRICFDRNRFLYCVCIVFTSDRQFLLSIYGQASTIGISCRSHCPILFCPKLAFCYCLCIVLSFYVRPSVFAVYLRSSKYHWNFVSITMPEFRLTETGFLILFVFNVRPSVFVLYLRSNVLEVVRVTLAESY